MIDPNEPLHGDAAERREVHAWFGLAMYWAQCVERELAVVLTVAIYPKATTPEERDALLEHRYDCTLGQLVKELARSGDPRPPELEPLVRSALKKRNWLAHDYFWDRARELLTSCGRRAMLDELERVVDDFRKLNDLLVEITTVWRRAVGITDEFIDAEVEKMREDRNERWD
jgi:hypothetical protein